MKRQCYKNLKNGLEILISPMQHYMILKFQDKSLSIDTKKLLTRRYYKDFFGFLDFQAISHFDNSAI